MRKKNELKSAGDLPGWFDRNSYEAAKDLDFKGWYFQLKLRQDAFCYQDFDESRKSSLTPEEFAEIRQRYSEGYSAIVNLLRLEPIPPITTTYGQAWLEGLFGPTFRPAVRSQTVGELMMHERSLSPGRKKYARHWIDGIDSTLDGKSEIVFKNKAWISRPVYESRACTFLSSTEETNENRIPGYHAGVEVDLIHPDGFLIEEFKKWLTQIRAMEVPPNVGRKFSSGDISSWVKYNVLAYLDLMLWAEEVKVSIPYRVIADAIFPPWEMDSETVRKTVAPLARSLIIEPMDGASAVSWLAAMAGNT